MKAAVVDAVGAGFKIAEVELAHPLGREVLIDVRASGLCHTDLTIATQDVGVFPMPVLCGHEVAGVVVDWCRPRSAWTRLSPVTRSSPTRKSAEPSSPDSESPKACALCFHSRQRHDMTRARSIGRVPRKD